MQFKRETTVVRIVGVVLVTVFYTLPWGQVHAQVPLPNVIIGEPNDPTDDIVGEPISEKELASSPALDDEIDSSGLDANDPISQSGYFQGDIVVATEDHLYQIIEGSGDFQTSAVRNPSLKWTDGVVPYVISSSFSYRERRVVGRAMQAFHSRTCIHFIPRQPHHFNYIHILKGRGCSSPVGRIGDVQVVSLGNGCVTHGIVIHEFMHAIGFWHEQSRADRDRHVTINWSNILPDMKFNFDKKTNWLTQDLGQNYDYSSVMHYGAYDFAVNPYVPTIMPKVHGVTIGQRIGFSQLDVDGINKLYQCSKVTPTLPGPTSTRAPITFRPFTTSRPKPSPKPFPKPSPKPSPKPTESCYDAQKLCRIWAKKGKCTQIPSLKKYLCRKSCGACETVKKCEDEHRSCGYWKNNGECLKNPEYMNEKCPASCGICS